MAAVGTRPSSEAVAGILGTACTLPMRRARDVPRTELRGGGSIPTVPTNARAVVAIAGVEVLGASTHSSHGAAQASAAALSVFLGACLGESHGERGRRRAVAREVLRVRHEERQRSELLQEFDSPSGTGWKTCLSAVHHNLRVAHTHIGESLNISLYHACDRIERDRGGGLAIVAE